MPYRCLKVLLLSHICISLTAQTPDSLRIGIHQAQNDYYFSKPGPQQVKSPDLTLPAKLAATTDKRINRLVIGWHPYWATTDAYKLYDYTSLTHIAYFSYEVDTATGGYTTIRDWNTTALISYAHNRGTKVLLTVTNFGSARNTELLSDTTKQVTLLNTVASLLKGRNGDGVNFDFETLPLAQRANMVDFIRRAVRIIKSELPSAEISIASPAVDWSGSWDLANLSLWCDYIIVMGYDYYWKGSSTAGPVAPVEGENYNVTRTINTYLSAGVPPGKLILGVPWYGYDWPVVSSVRKSPATAAGTARFMTAAEALASTHGRTFDGATKVQWTPYKTASTWRQLWFDDSESLRYKYDLVNKKNIGGIGIWALSYEGGNMDVWNEIAASFSAAESDDDAILKLFPSPTNGRATVELFLTRQNDVKLSLYNMQGVEVVVIESGTLAEGHHIRSLDLTGFTSGVYLCVLRAGTTVSTMRILYIRN